MASQPPSRPWFRLASVSRPVVPPAPAPQPPPQAPTPAPQPRPTISLPPFRPTAPPPPQEVPPPPPSLPTISSPPPPPPSVPPTPPRPPVEPPLDVPAGTPPRTTPSPVSSSPPVRTIAAPTSALPASPAKPQFSPTPPPPPPAVTLSPVKPQVPSPAPKSLVSSPPKPAITMPAQMPTLMPSPKVVKPAAQTPPQSPSVKPVAPPPSPLKLPPPQLRDDDQPRIPPEAEQKTVLVQETVPPPPPSSRFPSLNGRIHPDETLKAGIGRDTKNGDAERHRGPRPRKLLDSGEVPGMKVITIAGENKGATMELIRSSRHPPPHHLLHDKAGPTHKSNGQESRNLSSPSSSADEGKEKMKKKDKSHQSKSFASPPINAFMNSNVQGVNNSILYNSACTHHDPGVHLALSRKPSNGSLHIKDIVKGHQP